MKIIRRFLRASCLLLTSRCKDVSRIFSKHFSLKNLGHYYRFDAKRIVHIAHAIRQICNFIMDKFFFIYFAQSVFFFFGRGTSVFFNGNHYRWSRGRGPVNFAKTTERCISRDILLSPLYTECITPRLWPPDRSSMSLRAKDSRLLTY